METSKNPRRMIGMGAPGANAIGLAGAIVNGLNCDVSKMDTLHEVRTSFGPMADATITSLFGSTITPFQFAPSSVTPTNGLLGIDSTFAANGQFQVPMAVVGIYMHFEPEAWEWSVPGNAWSAPAASVNAPISPDVFADNFDTVGSDGGATKTALGIAVGDTYDPAVLDWGTWIDRAFRSWVLAYNFQWRYGRHVLLTDAPLRDFAFMPEMAQGTGTAPIFTMPYVRRVNDYYRARVATGNLTFLPQSHRRTGSITVGAHTISKFSPDRSFDRVNAIFGGSLLRGLVASNDRVYRLKHPVIFPAGVDLGMMYAQQDSFEAGLMQAELSITQSTGTPIPFISPDANIAGGSTLATGGAATVTAMEQTSDSPPVLVQILARMARRGYKGGVGRFKVGMVGYELSQAQYVQVLGDSSALDYLYNQSGAKVVGG